jgi:hypothetical protein
MKPKYSIFFVLITVGCFGFAQDTTFSEKYFKLINTYRSIDEVYQAHPELKPRPPHIVIEDDEVVFYDDNGKVINTMPVMKEEEIPVDDPKFGIYPDYIKIHRSCEIIDSELLVIWKSYGYWDADHIIPISARVYNNKGEFITSIKPTHHVVVAPDKEHFATCFAGETGGDTIFIYDMSGNKYSSIVCESPDSKIKFSKNSTYLLVYDYNIKKLYVVNSIGEIEFIYSIDNGYLFDFYVSLNCQKILISLFFPSKPYISLLVNKRNNIIWEKPIARIKDCVFLENGQLLLSILEENGYQLALIHSDGNKLNTVACDDVILLEKNIFIIIYEEKYYEYEIDL